MHTTRKRRGWILRPKGLFIILLLASSLLTACVDEQSTSTPTASEDRHESFVTNDVRIDDARADGARTSDRGADDARTSDGRARATDGGDMQVEFNAELVAAHNRLGMHIFQQLLSRSDAATDGDNVFLSPTSIALALGMAYNGAEGETERAMAEALQLEDLLRSGLSREALNAANMALLQQLDANVDDGDAKSPGIRLDIANSIWYRQELAFHETFLRDNEQFYRALVAGIDFNEPESVDTVNDWVRDATEGLIPTVVDQLDADQIMMLINAVYFKGDWTTPFDKHLTRDMPFQVATGLSRTVPMMYRSGSFDYYADGFQAIRLPYGENERLAMYVFLPPADDDFQQFVRDFTYETMVQSFDRFAPAQGEVMLPRMDISYKSKLNEALQALGMGIAFDRSAANFGRMRPVDETRNVYIGDVIHQSVLKVDEPGTEAAAVTSVDFRVTSAPSYEFTFKADRPFVLAIRDDATETLLFVGAIVDPQ